MIAALFAVALMAAAPAAVEAAQTPAQAPPTKSEKPKKADMVCKKEAVIGSRMPTRVCMTQAEWDQRAVDDKDNLDAAQRNQGFRAN